jgi:hypothetical protein
MHDVRTIRVLVGDVPRMLRDIIEGAVRLQSGMELVKGNVSDLMQLLERGAIDVAIVGGTAEGATRSQRRLLADHPQLTMFVVTDDGRSAHRLEFRRTPVLDVSPAGLVDAIRAAVADGSAATSEKD